MPTANRTLLGIVIAVAILLNVCFSNRVKVIVNVATILLIVFRRRFLVCTVARSVVVNGDVATVFAYLADFCNAEEWDPNVKDARWVTQPQATAAVGDTFELTCLFQARASVTAYKITSADQNAGILTLLGESDSALLDDTITLHEAEEHNGVRRTRVEYQLAVQLKGKLAPVAFLLLPFLEQLATESIGGLVTTCNRKFGSGVRGVRAPSEGLGGRDLRSRKPPALAAAS